MSLSRDSQTARVEKRLLLFGLAWRVSSSRRSHLLFIYISRVQRAVEKKKCACKSILYKLAPLWQK